MIHSSVVGSGVVVVGAAVVVVVVLRCGRSKPSTVFPPTKRSFSLGLTTGRLSRPWPKRAIPSWFTNGLPMRSGSYQQKTHISPRSVCVIYILWHYNKKNKNRLNEMSPKIVRPSCPSTTLLGLPWESCRICPSWFIRTPCSKSTT